MKFKKPLISIASLTLLLGLTACGDPNYPRSFTVKFDTGETGVKIPDQKVKEGYTLTLTNDILNPSNSATHYLFKGWYENLGEENEKAFDVKTYRVTGDMTLEAKWIFPTDTPSNFTIAEDAFSKTVTWIQTGVSSVDDFKIEVIEAVREKNMIEDPILGGEIQDPDNPYIYTYDDADKKMINGAFTYDKNNYQMSFTRDVSYGGSKYKFYIYNKGNLIKEEVDIQFKGSGTEEDPYLVYNENDLKYLTVNDIDSNTYVELKKNVTIHSLYSEKIGKVFDGHLNGNDYTITMKNNSGLFYKLGTNADVKNIVFQGAISSTEPSIGVVANYNDGHVTNINNLAVSLFSSGGVVNDIESIEDGGIGGIVGTNLENGVISNCKVSGSSGNTIQGKIGVGGVAGVNYGRIEKMLDGFDAIIGAYNGKEASSAISNSYAGSVAGINYGTIYGIKSEGKINSRRVEDGKEGSGASNIGGVVGYNGVDGVIESVIWEGMRCVGDTNVGGIAGFNEGTIKNCMTGRRLRKPSNTVILERQFISPVIGSYNVGGIAGKISNTSKITNVLSTANVWAYKTQPYTLAERADNAVGIKHNFQTRVTETYLGRTYGKVINDYLTAPSAGLNVEIIDNLELVDYRFTYKLGDKYTIVDGVVKGEKDPALVAHYINDVLGSGFYYNGTYGLTVTLPSIK